MFSFWYAMDLTTCGFLHYLVFEEVLNFRAFAFTLPTFAAVAYRSATEELIMFYDLASQKITHKYELNIAANDFVKPTGLFVTTELEHGWESYGTMWIVSE